MVSATEQAEAKTASLAIPPITVARLNANGFCTNIEIVPGDFEPDGVIYRADARAMIGGHYDHATDVWTPAPVPVPNVITDRQLYVELSSRDLCTQEEARAMLLRGEIPAKMQAVIDKMPEADRFNVEMRVATAREYHRDDEFIAIFASDPEIDLSASEVDEIWISAAAR